MAVGRQVISSRPARAAGQRDKHVTIEQTPAVIPGGSFPVETWAELGMVWMSRVDVTADERFAAGQNSAYAGTIWVMPYRLDMDPEVLNVPKVRRLKYLGRIYNILTASVIGRKDSIELLTLAKVG
jgi:head-tail adaptor